MTRTTTVFLAPGRAGWLALGVFALASVATAQEQARPRTSSSVKVPAQGGGGVEPVPGAPTALEPSTVSRPARATAVPAPGQASPDVTRATSLQAVVLVEGEGTVELDGARQDVRPGSRLGGDTVRSVAPGRIVLERPAPAGEPGGPSLVIVTFDAAGKGKARLFSTRDWTRDPASATEAKQP